MIGFADALAAAKRGETCAEVAAAALPEMCAARVAYQSVKARASKYIVQKALAQPARCCRVFAARVGLPRVDARGDGAAWGYVELRGRHTLAFRIASVWFVPSVRGGLARVPSRLIAECWSATPCPQQYP